MAPEILLLGANGQVGWELRRSLAPVGHLVALTRNDFDFTQAAPLVRTVRQLKPDIVVNAAAYTAVDKAESDRVNAFRLNAELPNILAAETKRLGALLVDYSTDYVFDGMQKEAYTEAAVPSPLGVYGQSKLEGLRAIQSSGSRHFVLRVSWVYGSHGANFLKTILRLARERQDLRVVSDQMGAPTPADLIADVTAHAVAALWTGRGEEGVFNLAPEGITSWHGFAQTIVRAARETGETLALNGDVLAITTAEYPTAARRPANSALDTSKLKSRLGFHLPSWEESVARIVREVVVK